MSGQPPKTVLTLYERGILNVHMEGEEGEDSWCICCSSMSTWAWPHALPTEAKNLYTQQEWNQFGQKLAQLYRTRNPNSSDQPQINEWIQHENERLKSVGLAWLIDSHLPQTEFILTWISQVREKYEFERADARRVANQPVPPKLKYSWFLSASLSSVAASSSPVDHLLLYRYGVFSMHFIEYSASKMKKHEGFQSNKPQEAETLYTNDEWCRFAKDLTEVIRNHPTGQLPSDAVHRVINEENGRRAYLGVEWVFDTYNEERSQPRKWEFILTWIPEKRRAYERDHPAVRRISEEPAPRCLKYQWKPTTNPQSPMALIVSSSPMASAGGGENPPPMLDPTPPAYDQVISGQEIVSASALPGHVNPSLTEGTS